MRQSSPVKGREGGTIASQALAPSASARSRLYLGLSLQMVVIAAVGFWPTYFGPLVDGTVDKPVVIHLHALVYVGWLALFVTQATLAMKGRMRQHRRLGRLGVGYGVVVFLMGLTVTFSMFAMRVEAGKLDEARISLLAPLSDMVVFAPLFGAAVFYRRRPEIHKRLMVVVSTLLLVAAVARMSFLGNPPSPWAFIGVWTSPILVAMAHDAIYRRLAHPVYLMGMAILSVMTFRQLLIDTAFWRGCAEWLARWVV